MKRKVATKLLFAVALFIGVGNAWASGPVEKEVSLSDFLTDISEKHEVFFTYDTKLVSNTILNPNDYNYSKLNSIISKLEKKTKFDFEYLGNKYYVVYHKKDQKSKVSKLPAFNILGISKVDPISNLQNTVTGTVKDSDGVALAGVNIVEKGTSNGTSTDFDGNYSINVEEGATLVFSYIGFGTTEEAVGGRSTVNVNLSEGVQLDEFIVVGSRTAPRSNTDTPLPQPDKILLIRPYNIEFRLLTRFKRL